MKADLGDSGHAPTTDVFEKQNHPYCLDDVHTTPQKRLRWLPLCVILGKGRN